MLANHFLFKFCKLHKKELEFDESAYAILSDYSWRGNIRELENTMERIVLLNDNGIIDSVVMAAALPGIYAKEKLVPHHQYKEGLKIA